MNSHRTSRRRNATLLAASIAAGLIGLSGCVVASPGTHNAGATKSEAQAASSGSASSAPSGSASGGPASSGSASSGSASSGSASSGSASAGSSTPAAPTPDPATLDQPTTTYLGASWKIKPGTTAKVTVTVETPNPGVPHGDVTLLVDGKTYASGTLDAAGKATFSVPGLTPGDYQVSASFAANPNYAASEAKARTLHMMTESEATPPPPAQGNGVPANNQCPSSADACVDLTDNLTWLQTNGQVTYGPVKMLGGKSGERTPTGTFHVYVKEKMHYSKEFDNAPMPYSVFFVSGVAFHQGSLSVPSAGCVHLAQSSAITFFNTLNVGDTVYVYGAAKY